MNTTTAPVHPAIYVRMSRDQADDRLGVTRQREDCTALVSARGWPEPTVYEDNDLSAYSGRKRPAYERLLADLRSGAIDAVVAQHPDRLHRSTKELETFIDVVEIARARVETVQAGHYDLTTPSGRMTAKIIGAVAQQESEHKGERQERAYLQLAEQGTAPTTGVRPFGYTLDWSALDPVEAPLVREAADRILAGESLRGLCADWNRRGLTTTTGGRWQQWPMRRLLTAARNAGIRELFGTEKHPGGEGRRRCSKAKYVGQGNWPAVFDEATLERLRAILNDPSRRTSFTNARSYLLSGYLFCSECGKPLRARPRVDKVRRYICASGPMAGGCGAIAILAEPTEILVTEMVLTAVSGPVLDAALADQPEAAAGAEAAALAADREKMVQLAEDEANEVITRAEWQAKRKVLTERIEARTARLTQTTATAVLGAFRGVSGADVRAIWPTLGFDQQRAVIGAVIDRIVIGRGLKGRNRFDPNRVAVEWRA